MAVNTSLHNALSMAPSYGVGGAICRDADERKPGVKCLGEGGTVVQCSSSRRANDGHRLACSHGDPQGVMGTCALINGDDDFQVGMMMASQHQGSIA
jgi:hypothetical protein